MTTTIYDTHSFLCLRPNINYKYKYPISLYYYQRFTHEFTFALVIVYFHLQMLDLQFYTYNIFIRLICLFDSSYIIKVRKEELLYESIRALAYFYKSITCFFFNCNVFQLLKNKTRHFI